MIERWSLDPAKEERDQLQDLLHRFPARVFEEGRGSILVQLIFNYPDIRWVMLPDALSFEGIDGDDAISVRGPYKGSCPRAVRLGLEWTDAVSVIAEPSACLRESAATLSKGTDS